MHRRLSSQRGEVVAALLLAATLLLLLPALAMLAATPLQADDLAFLVQIAVPALDGQIVLELLDGWVPIAAVPLGVLLSAIAQVVVPAPAVVSWLVLL